MYVYVYTRTHLDWLLFLNTGSDVCIYVGNTPADRYPIRIE